MSRAVQLEAVWGTETSDALAQRERWNFAEAKRSLQESRKHDSELDQVYGKLLAEVFYRLDNAMKAFFRRVEAGEKPGFPRVRPRHNFFTLCYPAMYLKIVGNTLILPTGGGGKHGKKVYPNVVATLTEAPPEHFREVAISRDARGNYYASFSYHEQEETPQETQIVILVASTVVVGDLSQRQMVMKEHQERNKHLNRAVYNDWGLYSFLQMLIYKCQLYGKDIQFLDERDTSKSAVDAAISSPCHYGRGPIAVRNVDSSWTGMRIVPGIS